VINKIAPNPTNGEIFIKLESLDKRTVQFDFYNAIGIRVKSEKQPLDKGVNTIGFDVSNVPQGVYFIQTDVGKGRDVPMKFIKM
jgi:Secretion system C-terminal sorting domain